MTEPLQIPTLQEIEKARDQLGELVVETPVWHGRTNGIREIAVEGTDVFFKLELMQHTGSFKPRGALTVMSRLDGPALARGITAISAGNHAIAVAYAARVAGAHAKVVMPRSANPARVATCKAYGAEVVMNESVHEAFETVKRIEKEEGRFFVHPFEGPLTTLGTATMGWEICRQIPNLDAVVVPIGGGGLCSGLALAVKQCRPDCQIFGVEPEGAANMYRSFASGKPERTERIQTIADSLAPPYSLPYSFSLCKAHVDEVVLIDDTAMCRAMALLFQELKLAVEPAGAAATAALAGPLRKRLKGKRVCLVVCGANIDPDSFHRYLMRGMENR